MALMEDQIEPHPSSPWRFLPVALLAAGLAGFFALGLDRYVSFQMLSDHREELIYLVEDNIMLSALAYMSVYVAVIAFSLPGGAILSITGGFLFGTWVGSALTVIGATTGATLLFLAARTAFADLMRRKAGRTARRMRDGFRKNALNYLLFLRLVPIFPFWLVNLVPALLDVPLRTYVIGTVLGIIPGTVVYVSVGNGLGAVLDSGSAPDLGILFQPEIFLPLLGLAVLALVPVVYQRCRRQEPNHGADDE